MKTIACVLVAACWCAALTGCPSDERGELLPAGKLLAHRREYPVQPAIAAPCDLYAYPAKLHPELLAFVARMDREPRSAARSPTPTTPLALTPLPAAIRLFNPEYYQITRVSCSSLPGLSLASEPAAISPAPSTAAAPAAAARSTAPFLLAHQLQVVPAQAQDTLEPQGTRYLLQQIYHSNWEIAQAQVPASLLQLHQATHLLFGTYTSELLRQLEGAADQLNCQPAAAGAGETLDLLAYCVQLHWHSAQLYQMLEACQEQISQHPAVSEQCRVEFNECRAVLHAASEQLEKFKPVVGNWLNG